MKNKLKAFITSKNQINKIELSYLFLFFIFIFIWTIIQTYNYAPDEYMRYSVVEYIFKNGKLPLPNDPSVIAPIFNASYAYYPLLLGSVISAFFMKIVSFFTMNSTALLIAARMTSVLCSVGLVYFTIKIAKQLFDNSIFKWVMVIIASMIPQYIFLSTYVNNDMMALFSSAIIVYAWISIIKDKCNYKNSLLLSIGVILCALSYYNAYGWILTSVIVFITNFTSIKKKKTSIDLKKFLKYGLFASGIVLLCISYFFIRNAVVNKGDMLGINSFLSACEEGAIDSLKPSKRVTPNNLNMSYADMLNDKRWTGTTWTDLTYKSSIGYFGYMQYRVSDKIYLFYAILITIGLIGFIVNRIRNVKKTKKMMNILYICLFLNIIIPILLSLRYSYYTDYQPQGRYIYPMWIALVIMLSMGIKEIIEFLIKYIKNDKIRNIVKYILCLLLILMILSAAILATKTYIISLG